MEAKESKQDAWMKQLISKSSPDSPLDEFVGQVMKKIDRIPVYVQEKKSFLFYIRIILPWILLGILCFIVLYTSDILYFNFLPGKAYISEVLIPSFKALKSLVSSKFVSITMIITVSGCILFMLERLFARHKSVHRNYMI